MLSFDRRVVTVRLSNWQCVPRISITHTNDFLNRHPTTPHTHLHARAPIDTHAFLSHVTKSDKLNRIFPADNLRLVPLVVVSPKMTRQLDKLP